MSKTTQYSKVQNIRQTIRFNEPTPFQGIQGYYAAVIVTEMQAVADDGGLRDCRQITPVGAARTTIFSPTELAAVVQGTNNYTGNFLLNELTAVYTNAIGGLL